MKQLFVLYYNDMLSPVGDPLALARLQILLVPVGSINQTNYEQWSRSIKQFRDVRIVDVLASHPKGRFLPPAAPPPVNHLHVSYISHPVNGIDPLSLFRVAAFPLAIIGVFDSSTDHKEALADFATLIDQLVLPGSAYPLAKRLFGVGAETKGKATRDGELVLVPSADVVGIELAELFGDVIGEFGELAAALESHSGLQTLASTLLPTLSLNATFHASPATTPTIALPPRSPQPIHAMSLPPLGPRSNTPISRPLSSLANGTSSINRRSTVLTSPFSRKSAVNIASSTSPHTSSPVSGLAGGRLLKILGDLWLLSGGLNDAIGCYTEAIERTKNDALWQGAAQEGLATALICEAWEGRDGSDHTTPLAHSPIPTQILELLTSSLQQYSKSTLPFPTASRPSTPGFTPSAQHGSSGEVLLAKLYTSLSVRISHFLLLNWAAAGWGSIALSAIVSHALPRIALPTTRQLQLSLKSQIQRVQIAQAAQLALGPWHKALDAKDQLDLWVAVAWILRYVGMERREAGALREVVRKAIGLLTRSREETKPGLLAPKPVHAAVGLGLGMPSDVAVRRRESTDGNAALVSLVDRVLDVYGVAATRRRHGWPELQVEVAKEAVLVGEALPDHRAVIRYSLAALQSLHAHLSPQAQHHLSKTYPKALATARRRGLEIGPIPWWVPEPMVLSVEMASLQPNRLPVAHAEVASVKDLFLYNPRLKPVAGKTMAVQNEQLEFFVTVQNPFAFDLEVQDLSLSTTGATFNSSPLPLVIPPTSVQTVRLTGIATSSGVLTVRGAIIRLMDGCEREFLLPVIDAKETRQREKRKSQLHADQLRIKRSGLASRADPPQDDAPTGRYLETTVVPAQPLLWIKRTSLTHGSVMLYDGEESTIRITLENTSSVPVNFAKVTFDDSTARAARAALAGDLSPAEAYEIEWDLLHRPVFQWQTAEVSIAPGAKHVLSVRCFGKVGCTDGSIRIDYGHIDGALYTRQITLPVLLTVFHTLESHSLNLVRLDDTRCLLSVDVRNVYGQPFEVALDGETTVTRLIPPGSTERLLLPILRKTVQPKPIPSLSDRQFVVAKEATDEVLFWHREELLSSFSGRWQEPGTLRHGSLSVRNQHFTSTMLDVYRLPQIDIHLEAPTTAGVDDFANVVVRVRNNSDHPYRPRIRLEPVSESSWASDSKRLPRASSKHLAIDGPLEQVGTALQPGETYAHTVSIAFLAAGRFTFQAAVEEALNPHPALFSSRLAIIVN